MTNEPRQPRIRDRSELTPTKQRHLDILQIMASEDPVRSRFIYEVMRRHYPVYAKNKFHRDLELIKGRGHANLVLENGIHHWQVSMGARLNYLASFAIPDWIPITIEEVKREQSNHNFDS